MADRLVLPTDLYPVAPRDAPEPQPSPLQWLINIVHLLAAQVEALSIAAAPTKHNTSTNPTADFDTAAGGLREHDALPIASKDSPLEYIDSREWTDFASRRPVHSRNACPPPAQPPRACGTLDTTRPTSFLLIPREILTR
jgi:hypothetical protein